MKSRLTRRVRTVVLATLVLTSTVLAADPVEAAPSDFATVCPEMTDSIYRLYQAVFLREPDTAGFDTWVDNYSNDGWHLLRIAQFFTESPEFVERYGTVSNDAFVELIYQNVLGRAPDAAGRTFWIDNLNGGLTRGGMLLFFSESEEYVQATNTAVPLAGYLRSYPHTTFWGCATSEDTAYSTEPVEFIDLFLRNPNAAAITVELTWLGQTTAIQGPVQTLTLQPGEFYYQWNTTGADLAPALANALHGVDIEIVGTETLIDITAIATNVAMPADRPGWTGVNGALLLDQPGNVEPVASQPGWLLASN